MTQKIIVGNGEATLTSSNIFECDFTRETNTGNDITLGSTPSAYLVAKVYGKTPIVTYGTQIKYYEDDELIATLYCERPTIDNDSQYTIEAYDSITKLEKSMMGYLSSISFPITLKNLAVGICQECGLVFDTETFPNADYQVKTFGANISARQLMECIGELASRYVYALPNGHIAFGWYQANVQHEIAYRALDNNKNYHVYYMDTLQYENYESQAIGGVELITQSDKSGIKYPTTVNQNVYEIYYNILLNNATDSELQTIAQNIYNELSLITYRPCRFRIPYTKAIKSGDIIYVTEPNGNRFKTIIFSASLTRLGYECSSVGNETRDSAMSRSENQMYQKRINGALSKFTVELDSIRSEVENTVIGGENLIENAIDLEGHTFIN